MRLLKTLEDENLTIYVERGGMMTFSSDRRGLTPLLRGVSDYPQAFVDAHVADRIIGLAAAYLLAQGKVGRVEAGIISEAGAECLEKHNIPFEAATRVPELKEKDELCPMELKAQKAGGVARFLKQMQRQMAQ